MSLIIHTIVKDGIVISADSRTTCKNEKGYTRYNDTAEKIFIFMDSVVITHCGNTMINTKLSVEKFLADFKREYYKNCRINELPVLLLNEYIKKSKCKSSDTSFLISWIDSDGIFGGYTYKINCKNETIELMRGPFTYGAAFDGTTDLAFAMMNEAQYNNMSLKEAIDLTEKTMQANITAYKYRQEQIIGGEIKTYVIDIVNHKAGWFVNGKID